MGKEIGIDFGTTTTEVSYIDKNGYARAMKLEKGYLIPTVLYFLSEDEYIIGSRAAVKGRVRPEAMVRNFKLFLTDPTKKYKVAAENGDRFTVKPVKAAQLFLNKLIQIIQPKLLTEFGEKEGTIDRAVITVPAQFDPEEKSAIKEAIVKAASQAGFSDIKIAAEPTAAAVAYQDENCEDGESILVYDFGGGTFDVSLICKLGDIYTEIATDGDKRLGGNRLTEKIAERLWEICLDETDRDYPFDEDEADHYSEEEYELSRNLFIENRNEVFQAAEDMKLEFLEEDEAEQTIRFYVDNDRDPRLIPVEMDLNLFYEIIEPDIQKTVDLTGRVLKEALSRGAVARIDQVVLAGGSSQIRLIREKLAENDVLKGLVGVAGESSTLISRGAAKLASVELKVEEKTRFEIGTRLIRGARLDLFEPVIRAGEKLPCFGTQVFYLARQDQNEVTIEYYEKDVKNYPDAKKIDDEGINLVSELTIGGIPSKPGLSLEVTFCISVDGTPEVTAKINDQAGQTVKAEHLTVTKGGNLY